MLRRPRQRAPLAGGRALRRSGRGGRDLRLAGPARAGLGDLPRPRPVRAGRGAHSRSATPLGRARRAARPGCAGRARVAGAPGRRRTRARDAAIRVDGFGNVALAAAQTEAREAGLAPGATVGSAAGGAGGERCRHVSSLRRRRRRARCSLYLGLRGGAGARRQPRRAPRAGSGSRRATDGQAARAAVSGDPVRRARTCICNAPTRPTSAPVSSRAPERPAARSSPPPSRARDAAGAGGVWSAPPGGALLYSALLRPLELAHRLLPLAVPLAVCEAVESLAAGRVPR